MPYFFAHEHIIATNDRKINRVFFRSERYYFRSLSKFFRSHTGSTSPAEVSLLTLYVVCI